MIKVILKGFISVPPSDLKTVENELPTHIALTLQEEGCLCFRVSKNHRNPFRFDVYEEFKDEGAFKAHQQRVENSRWGKITKNVERHYEVSHSEY